MKNIRVEVTLLNGTVDIQSVDGIPSSTQKVSAALAIANSMCSVQTRDGGFIQIGETVYNMSQVVSVKVL